MLPHLEAKQTEPVINSAVDSFFLFCHSSDSVGPEISMLNFYRYLAHVAVSVNGAVAVSVSVSVTTTAAALETTKLLLMTLRQHRHFQGYALSTPQRLKVPQSTTTTTITTTTAATPTTMPSTTTLTRLGTQRGQRNWSRHGTRRVNYTPRDKRNKTEKHHGGRDTNGGGLTPARNSLPVSPLFLQFGGLATSELMKILHNK